MKVITNTFGTMESPEFIKKIQGKDEFEWRTDEKVIALIEKRQNEALYLKKLIDENKATETQEYRFKFLTQRYKDWFYFSIEEVDTTRLWVISSYDFSTHIKYLDVVDEKLNFMGFI